MDPKTMMGMVLGPMVARIGVDGPAIPPIETTPTLHLLEGGKDMARRAEAMLAVLTEPDSSIEEEGTGTFWERTTAFDHSELLIARRMIYGCFDTEMDLWAWAPTDEVLGVWEVR